MRNLKKKKKKLSRPRILCDVQGHSRQQFNFLFFLFRVFFFPSFLPVFFATDVLCFCNCLCCMRREELAMQCFRLTQKKNHHALECECVRMWAGGQFVIKMYTHTHTHTLTNTHTHTLTNTHTLAFRGNTSILSSPSSRWDFSYLTWWSPDFSQPIRDSS